MFSNETEQQIEQQFADFVQKFPKLGSEVSDRIRMCGTSLGEAEEAISVDDVQCLLRYLYANMPLSDAVNYPFETFLEYAEHGAMLLRDGARDWKKEISERKGEERKNTEELFLECVVFHRVNTEGITPCRRLFYKQLKDRVAGKSLKDAILEVNYWCAEEVTYQCSDDRTLSAEAVYRSGTGRCGEESVFAVNALRSVGIPARQVYAHRWAHCDDNHAWVEVWCESKWHYLGACEPEEVLDKGWFTGAASRAMMINSRVYGNQKKNGKTAVESCDMTTAYPELERYARTVEFSVQVEDAEGKKIRGAEVSCELLNYAELVPVIRGITDERGIFKMKSGAGTLMISARAGNLEGSCVVDLRSERKCRIIVTEKDSFYMDDEWVSFDMNAPAEDPDLFQTGFSEKEERATEKGNAVSRGEKRKAQALKRYEHKMGNLGTPLGNTAEIRCFLEEMSGDIYWKRILIEDLLEKDLKDCTAEVLQDHFTDAMRWKSEFPDQIFRKYILAPRIEKEQPSAYRKAVRAFFSETEKEAFRKAPGEIRKWIDDHIQEKTGQEYLELITTPEGMLRYGYGTERSKEILFVAICRTLGIPAELDPVDGKAYALGESSHRSVSVRFQGRNGEKWSYGQNWTVSRRISHGWKTMNLKENLKKDGTVLLQEGEYRVITTNRLPGGDQFASVMRFQVTEGEEKTVYLKIRSADVDDMLMNIQLPDFTLERENGEAVSIQKQVDSYGAQVFIWLDAGKEPSEHILNEIRENADEFAKLGKSLKFIFGNRSGVGDATFRETVETLQEAEIYHDVHNRNQEILARRMYKDPGALPFLLVVDKNMTGVYAESGYNVGTGEMLLRIMALRGSE
ncbi:MAG TPA: transglutaminase domain-containing protein [Candidatus Mediterraneibacter excrementigallinarum]|nr:transglutaminase domain-containing protein [Candidatus Mediterraneibacter excrementigallinarum]